MSDRPTVIGVEVDPQTRCAHYHQDIDVIAIKHFCCGQYYPCHLCHAEVAGHQVKLWPAERFGEPAVLCGVCGEQLSVTDYLGTSNCPACAALFNPGCKLHLELYFEV
ncbi:CHY zinc finger protein [Glutamicibacter arilaitensis]|uniref:CHY zinc finger protein n=1 Tax=Glutamicibacter arilaitensis TaxID=256701 RepID=UPI00384D16AB